MFSMLFMRYKNKSLHLEVFIKDSNLLWSQTQKNYVSYVNLCG